MRTLTRKQAKAEGYIIDDCAARGPIGYKGPEYGDGGEWVNVLSEREEKLYGMVLQYANHGQGSGFCCCGDYMVGHADPMSCGHTPVDMLDYSLHLLLDELKIEGEV